jgi:hypothetical protein
MSEETDLKEQLKQTRKNTKNMALADKAENGLYTIQNQTSKD